MSSSAPGPGSPVGTGLPDPNAPLPDFDFSATPDWKGYLQRNLNIALITLSTFFIVLRLGTRGFIVKALGLDDLVGVIAYVALVTFSALEIRAVRFGSGAHIEFVPPVFFPKFFEAVTTQLLLYFWAVALARFAIVAFLLRMSSDKLYRRLVFTVAGVILVQTIVCFLFRLLECKNIKDLWKPPGTADCMDKHPETIMMWVHAVAGIAIDISLFSLPIWVVRKKMIWGRKALRVVMIFTVGAFAAITGIVRLAIMIRDDFTVNTTHKMATVAFWTDIEGHVGLWVACFPALQPLLRLVSFRLGLRSYLDSNYRTHGTGDMKSQTGGGSRSAGYGTTSRSGNFFRKASRRQQHRQDTDAASDKSSGAIVPPESMQMDDMVGPGIRKDVEFTVHTSRLDVGDEDASLERQRNDSQW